MKFKCIWQAIIASLVATLVVALILFLSGITTITLVSPLVIAILLFVIGITTAGISFLTLLLRINTGRCNNTRLFVLYLYAVALIGYALIGLISFLSAETISLFAFSVALFLLVGILFTQISIILSRLNNNVVE